MIYIYIFVISKQEALALRWYPILVQRLLGAKVFLTSESFWLWLFALGSPAAVGAFCLAPLSPRFKEQGALSPIQ